MSSANSPLISGKSSETWTENRMLAGGIPGGRFGDRPVVDNDLLGKRPRRRDPIEDSSNTMAREPVIDFDRYALTAAIVDKTERAKRAAVRERVAHPWTSARAGAWAPP